MIDLRDVQFPLPIVMLPLVMQKNPDVFGPYMLKQLMVAIRADAPEAVLFTIHHSTFVAKVVRADYTRKLIELKDQFIASEQYELANAADRTLRKHLANTLIAEINTRE